MAFTFLTTRHLVAILTATLAILTAHRAGTAGPAPSLEHSWQDHATSNQMKWKRFTKQKNNNN